MVISDKKEHDEEIENDFETLVSQGAEQGFLTFEEVNEALPENTSAEDMEKLIDQLEEQDIEILDRETAELLTASGKKKKTGKRSPSKQQEMSPATRKTRKSRTTRELTIPCASTSWKWAAWTC